jgi:tetratricopeptide (TPR) repeat protein
MKWRANERALSRTPMIAAAIAAGTLALITMGGCHHQSVEDGLAAGDLAMQNTKLAEAENDYREAALSAPNDPRPHVALGNLYVFEQKPAQAQGEFLKAIDLDKNDASAHAALGMVFESQSEPGLAEEQYRASVALAPANPAYRISLGSLLQRQGKMGEAEAELRTAVGLDPKNAHAHLALAKLLSGEPDRSAEAEGEFAQVRTLDPSLMTGAPASAAPAASAEPGAEATPAPSEEMSPAVLAPPPTESAPAAPAPAGAVPQVRPLNRKFLLTHDSPVYETPLESANVVAQVHRGKFVHVTGMAGNWFRIQMKNGTVGFIPVTAAE